MTTGFRTYPYFRYAESDVAGREDLSVLAENLAAKLENKGRGAFQVLRMTREGLLSGVYRSFHGKDSK